MAKSRTRNAASKPPLATKAQFWPPSRTKAAVALVLTFGAGVVDIVGFLTVYNLFTAHMTGTTVHMAKAFISHQTSRASAGAVVVASFVLASIAARMLVHAAARLRWKRIGSVALAVEAVLLALVWPLTRTHGPNTVLALALLAAAMGIQTATLTHVGPLTIHTTFVTGMLNRFAELVSGILFRRHDLRAETDAGKQAEEKVKIKNEVREMYFISAIWLLYAGGAAGGALFAQVWSTKALYLPCLLLLCAIASDQWQPIAVEEEREQLQQ